MNERPEPYLFERVWAHPASEVVGDVPEAEAVFDEAGRIKPADLVYLSFSFDHRILDGAIGAAFGNAVVRRLQNPAALLVTGEAT